MNALINWNNEVTNYIQDNNPQEAILYKEDGKGFLEFCGATAIVSLLHACGFTVKIKCPGVWSPQPEGTLGDFFHDERNYKEFKKIRPNLDPYEFFNNRVPQFYPYAIKQVFNVDAEFEWENLKNIGNLLKKNIGVMVCLRRQKSPEKVPGHFISIVNHDEINKKICYNDPWKNNYWPKHLQGTSNFNRWIDEKYLFKNLTNYRVLVGV